MFNFFKKKPVEKADDESTLADGLILKEWGSVQTEFEDTNVGVEFRKIVIKPGKTTSLHRHLKRREYWLIASGVGEVEVADNPQWGRQTYPITEGKEAVMGQGRWHRIRNTSEVADLIIYELAIGDISEEDSERWTKDV